MLNPFRGNATATGTAPASDKGVEAFKRLMFSNTTAEPEPIPDNSSRVSTTGMTFVYSSEEDNEEDDRSAIKHSPETQQQSPKPIYTNPSKPAPPPSRKRGASGSNQQTPVDLSKSDSSRRPHPPVPPLPRRSPSSASKKPESLERASSLRQEKPVPPPPRRKLSDASEPSFDPPPISPPQHKRSSVFPPPPPPPPRTRGETTGDSELSLELGRLQREVDQLVFGLTKKRGKG
jgi:hypothetical protein